MPRDGRWEREEEVNSDNRRRRTSASEDLENAGGEKERGTGEESLGDGEASDL